MVNYLLKKYATDATLAEYEASIRRYMQPTSMTSEQFTDDLIAKSCKVAAVYVESTFNDVFIKGVDVSIRHSLRDYWASHPYADLTDIAFHADSLLAIQKGSRNVANNVKID